MVDQPVYRRRGRHRVLEDALPLRERQIADQHDAAADLEYAKELLRDCPYLRTQEYQIAGLRDDE